MGIKLSGMVSGMDTEAMVSALVSAYSVQKDNLVKAQTKLSWKQESWKTMNTSIYGFYSGKLAAAKMSKTYALKKATVSNSTYATVSAGTNAVVGSQSLQIKKLAATGYLTGGKISGKDENGNQTKLKGESKLSEIATTSGNAIKDGRLSVTVDGKTTDIEVSGDMTVNQFVAKLKDAGVSASFDEQNQRFFISAKSSGADNDFSIVAGNQGGLDALKSLGIFTVNDTEKAEYKKWAEYTPDELASIKENAYNSAKVNYEDVAKSYAEQYNAAKKIAETMEGDATLPSYEGLNLSDSFKRAISETRAAKNEKYKEYAVDDGSGNPKLDDKGNIVVDTDKLTKDGKLAEYNADKAQIDAMENNQSVYEKNKKIMADTAKFVDIDADNNAIAATDGSAAYDNVKKEVDEANATIRQNTDKVIDDKVALAKQAVNETDGALGAVRIVGADSQIVLNGAVFENSTNTYSINGLTIEATGLTGSETVMITTGADVDAVYDTIKGFIKEYNDLIKAMDTAYNASSSKGYEPLTSEEKEAMTEDEIEKWETKIKDSLLRKDSTLGNASSAMKTIMSSAIEINGKSYSLASFGIKTQSYFSSGTNEKGVYHIDGDKDDSVASGNDDKLREAIANDPDTLIEFFTKLSTKLYDDLGKRMSSTSMSSIYTIYNDKEMATQYSEYNTKISDQEDKISTWEDYYYDKFSRMESALAQLQSSASSITNLLG